MNMTQKETFTKDQIVQEVGIQPYMIAAWEKQFEIAPTLIDGEHRYTTQQLMQLRTIKELLYEKGLSMDAAKKYLHDQPDLEDTTLFAASPLLFQKKQPAHKKSSDEHVMAQLLSIKDKLIKIRNSLS